MVKTEVNKSINNNEAEAKTSNDENLKKIEALITAEGNSKTAQTKHDDSVEMKDKTELPDSQSKGEHENGKELEKEDVRMESD